MATIESTRAIVESGERFDGTILPTERAEIARPVTIREEATVLGGVYGEEVDVASGAVVQGSIMASNAVDLADCEVTGAVGTPGRIRAEGVRAHSTITGTKVHLTDCVVRGNVVGADVILENCVVLGLIVGERSLDLDGCLCYTFKSYTEATLAETDVILPQAIVDGNLTLETPVDVVGLDDSNVEGEDALSLTRDDLLERDGTRYLTLADRILNLEAAREEIEALEAELWSVVIEGAGDEDGALDRLAIAELDSVRWDDVGDESEGDAGDDGGEDVGADGEDAGEPSVEWDDDEADGEEDEASDESAAEEASEADDSGPDADVVAEPVDEDEEEFFDL